MQILVFNPGGNSLKASVVECNPAEKYAFEAQERVTLSVEGIGNGGNLLKYAVGPDSGSERIHADTYSAAAESMLGWLDANARAEVPKLKAIDRVAIRVVHGGPNLTTATEITDQVASEIESLEKLAPLHNRPSLEVLKAVRARMSPVPAFGVFDSAFHRTIPEEAALYAIPTEISKRHHIRRYGFHGISHRYMLERYAFLQQKEPLACNVITMHLESGCSMTAIRKGHSVENTMGLTPLEGLMMGTRSGDVDPALIQFLVREEGLDLEEVMVLLNKQSGLLGVSQESLDTRVLMNMYDSNSAAKLAIDMFCYRILKAVGSYLAILGGAEAIVFGGGIGANGVFLRRYIGERLGWCGLEIDPELNDRMIDREGRISTAASKIEAWVMVTQEALQIAQECSLCP